MNAYDQQYYFIRCPDNDSLPFLTPDVNTEDRKFSYEKQAIGSAPLVFFNGSKEYQQKKRIPSMKNLPEILFSGADLVVTSRIREALLELDFTSANFSMYVPFTKDGADNVVTHKIGEFNSFNVGTCEKSQEWLFSECINKNIDFHFSGHSHRAGIYKVSIGDSQKGTCKISAFDPDLAPNHQDNSKGRETKLIVSSCGGSIGVQNHDEELYSFNLRSPSGSLLNENATPLVRAIKTDGKQATFSLPRLCVALDYLWVMWMTTNGENSEEPIQFHNPQQILLKDALTVMPESFAVRLGKKITRLDCLRGANFWIFNDSDLGGDWQKIEMTLSDDVPANIQKKGYRKMLKFSNKQQKKLIDSQLSSITRGKKPKMFCEILLKKPNGIAVQNYNSEDSWIFPIHIGKTGSAHWFFFRPRGEIGEIPDWAWLGENYPGIYPKSK